MGYEGNNIRHFFAKVMKNPLCNLPVLSSPAEDTPEVITKMQPISILSCHLEGSYSGRAPMDHTEIKKKQTFRYQAPPGACLLLL